MARRLSEGQSIGLRRAAFWGTVGGVSLLSGFLLELLDRKVNSPGIHRLVQFIHSGGQ
jgi:hypothetical protein